MEQADGTITRRVFVKRAATLAAATAASGIGGAAVWDRLTQPDDPAEIWSKAAGTDRIILAATLAPSSHNTQPWRFRIGPKHIDLLGDSARTMGKADPRLRELHISLGCAVENAVIAAADSGSPVVVEQVPGTPGSHFARLRFAKEGAEIADAHLAAAIPSRHTNRGPYDANRAVANATLEELAALASDNVRVVWLTDRDARKGFTDLSVRATGAQVADAEMQRDSHRWYRMSRAEADEHRDGITVSGANLPAPVALALGLFPPTPTSFDAGWAKATAETHCGTAPTFGLLVVENANDRGAWVEAGRTYQRIGLTSAMKGIATHPISQALAIRDREVSAGAPGAFAAGLAELGGSGEVVLAFRIGYPSREQLPAMRRTPGVA